MWTLRASCVVTFLLLLMTTGCFKPAENDRRETGGEGGAGPVVTGAQVLLNEDFERLRGLRVGLIVNHTARVTDGHLADLMAAAPGVELTALFGPEHGIRGTADAGAVVGDSTDADTCVPVYSLYGQNRSPTDAMLDGIDALVFDIQDIGARFYTYISTMGLSMQAAARRGIPFFVLDRPNPLSGEYVSGFVLEPEYRSFVGEYPIPVAHGMTVGELALMIQGEAMLESLDSLDLRIVEMEGWARSMQWPETGLEWISPSPNIPDFETALVYPGACFVEATSASEGRGTKAPFLTIGAAWGEHLAADMNRRGLPGVRFDKVAFTPESIPGMSTQPKLLGESLQGIRFQIGDRRTFRPVETGIHLLIALFEAQAEYGEEESGLIRARSMQRLAGTQRLKEMIEQRRDPEEIIASWQEDVDAFRERRVPYLIYP
jgi:uncharacterized protein YbbC (DUF1343 family)